MANLKAIRKRIQGVKGTQQLTKAMKLVAAAKLRRAQENALALRPYSQSIVDVISHLASKLEEGSHPLLDSREIKRVLLLVFTSDRGLCGAFNLNVCRAAEDFLHSRKLEGVSVGLAVIGKKGNDYLTRRGYQVSKFYKDLFGDVTFDRISRIGNELARKYVDGSYDGLFVLYNYFHSAGVQRVRLERILPIQPEKDGSTDRVEHLFEPDRRSILDTLFPMYVNTRLYHSLLESVASEMGARMTAMDNATRNAADLIRKLTLLYNKARQEAITKELMDIVSGAEALG